MIYKYKAHILSLVLFSATVQGMGFRHAAHSLAARMPSRLALGTARALLYSAATKTAQACRVAARHKNTPAAAQCISARWNSTAQATAHNDQHEQEDVRKQKIKRYKQLAIGTGIGLAGLYVIDKIGRNRGNTALHNAVLLDDEDRALFLASQADTDIGARNWDNETALQLAVDSGNSKLFTGLLAIADKKNLGNAVSGQELSVHTKWYSESIPKIEDTDYISYRDRFKQLVLTNQIGVNQAISHSGSTLLHLATDFQDYEMVSLLLKRKADPNLESRSDSGIHQAGNAAIHRARGPVMAGLLKQAGANINQQGYLRQTPLHYSSKNGNYALTQWLLENGANVDAKDAMGENPIFGAKTVEMVQLFKKHNASLTLKGNWNGSLLHNAMKPGYDPKIILEYGDLAQNKELIMYASAYGKGTPWHKLARNCYYHGEESDLHAKVHYFLPYGRSLLMQSDDNGTNAAHRADMQSRADVICDELGNECYKTIDQCRLKNCKTLAAMFVRLASEKQDNNSKAPNRAA